MVYRDLDMIKDHFSSCHFHCVHPDCVQDVFMVFETQKELDYHTNKTHNRNAGGKGGISANALLGGITHDEDDGYYLQGGRGESGGRGGRGGGRGAATRGGGRGGGVVRGFAGQFDKTGIDFTSVVEVVFM